ncbi:MAG TPA: alkaline phosphatase family protein [Actinomycetota bacterium]|nr:alkaline phosphatase family protein [Actinomycetota bacterium]
MAPKLVILGWDSATFDVIDPLRSEGRLPVLDGLIGAGTRSPLRSTWPPMTDCAWTSAFTGSNPGRHGIFGSWYRAPGAYACRYFSSRDRRAPALWELTEDVRHLVWNVPMAFPPQAIEGAMVSGYGAPPGSRFCEPASLQRSLAERFPLEDLVDRAPHGSLEDFFDDLVRGLEVQARAIVWAATEVGADCVTAVWPQVDRAQHFFWQFRENDHPLADAVTRVYEAMDAATGTIVEAFADANFLVVSDHGAGSLNGDVNLGLWLVENGHAEFAEIRRAGDRGILELAWLLPPSVRRFARGLAPGLARKVMSATLSGALAPFDWTRSRAFVGFHGDLWLNLSGREPAGIVSPGQADAVRDEIRSGLLELTDPRTGSPVFADVHRRDDIYSGPHVDLAPDLMLDSWTNGYRVAPSRGPEQELVGAPLALAGVDASWSADHRPLGVWVAAGPEMGRGSVDELALYDVCPTALALLDQPVPAGIDGAVAAPSLDAAFLTAHPVRTANVSSQRAAVEDEYSETEAAAVAEHLKDLGYIE